MPFCYCYTNLADDAIPKGFELRLSRCISEVLPDKPIEVVNVVVVPNARIAKAGNSEPAMIVQFRAMNVFNAEKNPLYFPKFFCFLKSELNLPEKRFTIEFVDVPAHFAKSGD